MGVLRNFVNPLHRQTKRNYLERMINEKVNCSNNQMQNIIWIEYSNFFGKGEIGYHEVSQDEYLEWTSADPSSVMQRIINKTCNFKSTSSETENSINPDENKPKIKKKRA